MFQINKDLQNKKKWTILEKNRVVHSSGERGISFADPVVRDGFRIRKPPALARRLAFSLLPAFEQARRGHSQKNPQQMLRVS